MPVEKQELRDLLQQWRDYAEEGDADSMFKLGTYYEARGRKTGIAEAIATRECAEAAKWYRMASDASWHADAEHNLGKLYYEGKGAEQDYSEAARQFQWAADQEHAGAQFQLAVLFGKGRGVKQSYPEAAKWLRMAANQGEVHAQRTLATYYELGKGGFKQNRSKAIEWLTRAAEKGDSFSKERLEHLQSVTRVKVIGFRSGPELNGEEGTVVSFSAATDRYAVQLDRGGPPIMLKTVNLLGL